MARLVGVLRNLVQWEVSQLMAGWLELDSYKVSSNPNHFMILRSYDFINFAENAN